MNRDQNNERRERAVSALIDSESTLEGGGFPVRRPFPSAAMMQVDPFLLLDHLGPVTWGPGEASALPIIRTVDSKPSLIYCRAKCSTRIRAVTAVVLVRATCNG